MSSSRYDAVIVGGGPGGSAAATFLARAGRRVLLLEREIFPRFHIGESLLPYNRRIFSEMGVLPALESAGFLKKLGAQFHLGNKDKNVKFVFREGAFTREPEALQVERAPFDHLLLKHAAKMGAEVKEGWTVQRFVSHPDHVEVQARESGGTPVHFTGRFLIDASGRANLTGNQAGIKIMHPRLKKVAIYGHFDHVRRDAGPKGADTVIVRLENKWFWCIPLTDRKTSVGCVMDKEEFARASASAEELFHRFCSESSAMKERMAQAKALTPLQTTTDFSYRNQSFVGPRLLRVGDAAGFMDPIFSAGVYLAMYSGKLAAQAVDRAVRENHDGAALLQAYHHRILRSMRFYWQMVEHFYTTPFMEIFLEPREKFNLPAAVNAVLAGELEGGWKMAWRMRLFFWLIKLQAKFPLVPRLSFQERPPADSNAQEPMRQPTLASS